MLLEGSGLASSSRDSHREVIYMISGSSLARLVERALARGQLVVESEREHAFVLVSPNMASIQSSSAHAVFE